ncbi:leucyl/phenylalanyl-tRNA--protein transferase [Colwellia sp. MEBiC06753]
MSQTIAYLEPDSLAFPPLSHALSDPNGLLAIGGDLSPERLLTAYANGIFPWFSDGDPIMWWSPDPRAIIPIDAIKVNRTLRKVINRAQFEISINKAFDQVISLCADAPFRLEETWILPEMITAYRNLHKLGFAHSIEVWMDKELVGGLYGIAINGFFSGESMFYSQPNASKLALVALSKLLATQNIRFIDCQLINPFLADMGCIEVSRTAFVKHKQLMQTIKLADNFWQQRVISINAI